MIKDKMYEFIFKIDKLDNNNLDKMIGKFGKQITYDFLNDVIGDISNSDMDSESKNKLLDKFSYFINDLELGINDLSYFDDNSDILTDSFRQYLNDVGKYNVLSVDDEKKYCNDLNLIKKSHLFKKVIVNGREFLFLDLKNIFLSIDKDSRDSVLDKLYNYFSSCSDLNNDDKILLYYVNLYNNYKGNLNKDDLIKYFDLNDKYGLFKQFDEDKGNNSSLFINELDDAIKYMTAKNAMVNHNLRLVIHVAKWYYGKADMLDLICEGNFGLLNAIERYDVSMGNRFSTYATYWIRQAITRALATKYTGLSVSVDFYIKMQRFNRMRAKLVSKYGRELSIQELSRELNISERDVSVMVVNLLAPKSLNVPLDVEDGDAELGDFIRDDNVDIESHIIHESLHNDLNEVMDSCLSDREIYVLKSRVGMDGYGNGNPMTLDEIGKVLNVTRERVRQIERNALVKVKRKRGGLRDYMY